MCVSIVEHECPMCETEFETDTVSDINMIYMVGFWLPECPKCGWINESERYNAFV